MNIRALLALCAITAAGCGDSTEPDPSTVSFTYTGAGAANATNFSVTGTIPANIGTSSTFGTSPWAAGYVDAAINSTGVIGVVPKAANLVDLIGVVTARTTPGTSPVEATCDIEDSCTGVFFWLGFHPDGDQFDNYMCNLTTGSVTISTISEARISGSFSGSGSCVSPSFVETPFTITNGTFSVAVSAQLSDG